MTHEAMCEGYGFVRTAPASLIAMPPMKFPVTDRYVGEHRADSTCNKNEGGELHLFLFLNFISLLICCFSATSYGRIFTLQCIRKIPLPLFFCPILRQVVGEEHGVSEGGESEARIRRRKLTVISP